MLRLDRQILHWVCSKVRQSGKGELLIFGIIRPGETLDWVDAHNPQVKYSRKGVRLLICYLPRKSPGLNSNVKLLSLKENYPQKK